MEQASSGNDPSSSGTHVVTLTAADVPGAELPEPFEVHAIPALQRWLLCRGIKAASSWKKAQLIKR